MALRPGADKLAEMQKKEEAFNKAWPHNKKSLGTLVKEMIGLAMTKKIVFASEEALSNLSPENQPAWYTFQGYMKELDRREKLYENRKSASERRY